MSNSCWLCAFTATTCIGPESNPIVQFCDRHDRAFTKANLARRGRMISIATARQCPGSVGGHGHGHLYTERRVKRGSPKIAICLYCDRQCPQTRTAEQRLAAERGKAGGASSEAEKERAGRE